MKIMDTKLGTKANIYLEWENTSWQCTTIKKLWHPKYYKLQRNNNLHFYNLFAYNSDCILILLSNDENLKYNYRRGNR